MTTDSTARSDSALGGWLPIETAPKDGRGVLMIDMTAIKPQAGMGYWAVNVWSCVDPSPEEGASRETIQAITWLSPTHWRPLPEPPTPQNHLQHKG